MFKSTGPRVDLWRTPTHHRPPLGHRAIDHNPLTAYFQPIPHAANSSPLKRFSLQSRDKDVVWDKALTEVQVDSVSVP